MAEMIRADHVPSFEINDQVYKDEIEDLDAATSPPGDTYERLSDAAEIYMQNHPLDYPGFASIIEIRWAKRVTPAPEAAGEFTFTVEAQDSTAPHPLATLRTFTITVAGQN